MDEIDFEAEGFLAGLEGDARDARRQLVNELLAAGIELDELRRAVRENRLATLPLEHVFTSDCVYTVREVIDEFGLSEDFARRNYLSLGLPYPGLDEPAISNADKEAWRMIKLLFDGGVDEETVLTLGRTSGRNAAQTAEMLLETFPPLFAREGDTERDYGLRLAEVARALSPALGPMMTGPVRLHMRELARREAVVQIESSEEELPGTREICVCFADLVGFTALTERVGTVELSAVTGRLETLAADCAQPPVRLVKLIGDAAMFVSSDAAALVETVASLIDRADADAALPQLRAGVAAGRALNRSGDWYGRPVNLAARIAGAGEPNALTADTSVVERTRDAMRWESCGSKPLKGIGDAVELFRLARG
ncbi:MAG: adenylate cyclase [Thermoleophilaceae bacterium]|nr:adenylate cyclase [Thermoleophilaceae bacterium]